MLAKMNGSVRVICAVVCTVVVLLGVASAWYDHVLSIQEINSKATQQDKDITKLEDEGCDPAQKNFTSIAVMKNQLDNIEKAQTDNTITILQAIGER